MDSKYKCEVISGDAGSVRNELNKLLKSIDEIVSVTQSPYGYGIIITIIYVPKILGDV